MSEDRAGTYNILRMLARGKTKFSELLQYVPRQTLSERLRELEKFGYVERAILDSRPPRPEYSITPAGREMLRKMALERYRSDIDDVFLVAPSEAAQITDEYLKERKYQPKGGLVRSTEAGIPQAQSEKRLIEVLQLRSPVSPEKVQKILKEVKHQKRNPPRRVRVKKNTL